MNADCRKQFRTCRICCVVGKILLQSATTRANHSILCHQIHLAKTPKHTMQSCPTALALMGDIPWKPKGSRQRARVGVGTCAHGRARFEISTSLFQGSVLGLMVGCPSHDRPEEPLWLTWWCTLCRMKESPLRALWSNSRVSYTQLDAEGFFWRPWWPDLRIGLRPPLCIMVWDPCEWQHGWQFWTSSVSDSKFRQDKHVAWLYRRSSGPPPFSFPNATQEWLGARAHLTRVRDSTILVQNRGS